MPDYLTSVKEGGFYGWPYSYFGANVDERVKPPRPDLVAKAIKPDYALGPHTASLGLASAQGNALKPEFENGMFIGQHGSWNRKPHSGYKVVFVPFAEGRPSGMPVDVLTGFLSGEGEARGRPVGVAIDRRGGAAGGGRHRQHDLAGQRGKAVAAGRCSPAPVSARQRPSAARPGTPRLSGPSFSPRHGAAVQAGDVASDVQAQQPEPLDRSGSVMPVQFRTSAARR